MKYTIWEEGVLLYYYNIQCNLVYPEPRLSGARDLKIHYGEKCRHFSYPDISLIRYGSDRPVDKGVRIIEVALYYVSWFYNMGGGSFTSVHILL